MDIVKVFAARENAREAASENHDGDDEGKDGPGPSSSNTAESELEEKKRGSKRADCDNGEGVIAKRGRGRPPKKKAVQKYGK